MFSPSHEIWKFSNAGDELDDWLPYAEDLIRMWSNQNNDEVKFQTTFEIIIAAFLLKDDLLPASAKAAFANVMLKAIDEATRKKLHFKSLHIRPPKPGRKENRTATFIKCHEVMALIKKGKTATEAYKVVAEKRFKSPDTIRRRPIEGLGLISGPFFFAQSPVVMTQYFWNVRRRIRPGDRCNSYQHCGLPFGGR